VFKHLLSRIAFEIVATDLPSDGVNVVTLEELSLNGAFASSGTVTLTDAAPKVTANMTEATAKYEMKDYFGYSGGDESYADSRAFRCGSREVASQVGVST
jgi:hypothetical protein